MIRFRTEGSARRRGKESAAQTKDLALRWQQKTYSAMAGIGAQDLRAKKDTALRWMDEAGQVLPGLVEELQALANALGIPWENYALATFSWRFRHRPACSTFGGWDADGRAIVAKTDDLLPDECGMNVMQECIPDTGIPHVKFHFAGTLYVSSGWNAKGLFAGLTGIPGPEADRPGVLPLWFIPRILECCSTVAEACETVESLPCSYYGCSLLLADAGPHIALVEKNAGGFCHLPKIEKECYVHTNHILDAQLSLVSPPQRTDILANSMARYEFLKTKLAGQNFSREFARKLFRDSSIFQSGNAPLHTDYAVLAVPSGREYFLFTQNGTESDLSGSTVIQD